MIGTAPKLVGPAEEAWLCDLTAPFPYFGGKRRAAHLVWPRFGNVPNYVEPFAGSLAVLLKRPHAPRVETVNDLDCMVANFWRSVARFPEETAAHCDWPVNEADLHAVHVWLTQRVEFRERMHSDIDHCDPLIAGRWVWGLCQWIGSGWCSTPDVRMPGTKAQGVCVKRPRLARCGRGVSRQLPQLGGCSGAAGCGVHASGLTRKMPAIGDLGRGAQASCAPPVQEWFAALADRLRHVRVCCGDWSRVLGPSPTTCIGVTGAMLDPPYGTDADRQANIYTHDDLSVAGDVREWALAHGGDPKLRIALCGYEGEHAMPDDWECVAWKAHGGYSGQSGKGNDNAHRERIWFSPHCLKPNEQPSLFDCEAS